MATINTGQTTDLTLNPFDYFPLELNKLIFSKLSISQLMQLRRVSRQWKTDIENICQLTDQMDIVDVHYIEDKKFQRALVLNDDRPEAPVTKTNDSGLFLATLFPNIKKFSLYIYRKRLNRPKPLNWMLLLERCWAPQLISLDLDNYDANHLKPFPFPFAFPQLKEFILRESPALPHVTCRFVHAFLDKMPTLQKLTVGQLVTNPYAIRSLTHLTIKQSCGRVYDCDHWQMIARHTNLRYLNLTGLLANWDSLTETLQHLPNLQTLVIPVNMFTCSLDESEMDLKKKSESVVELQFVNTWFWQHFSVETQNHSRQFRNTVKLFVTIFPNVRKLTFFGPCHPNSQEQAKEHLKETFVSLFTANNKSVETVYLFNEIQ